MSELNEWDLIASGTSIGFMVTVAIWNQWCNQHVMGLRWTINVAEASSFSVSSLNESAGLNYAFEKQDFLSLCFWSQPYHVKYSTQPTVKETCQLNRYSKNSCFLCIVWSVWFKIHYKDHGRLGSFPEIKWQLKWNVQWIVFYFSKNIHMCVEVAGFPSPCVNVPHIRN